jgi:nicotinamidase-related amidase
MTKRVWDDYLSERDRQVFAAMGSSQPQGFGKRPALLVVDVNYAFAGERAMPILDAMKIWHTCCGEEGWKAIPVIRALLDAAHGRGVPVIYSTNVFRADKWDSGSWAWKNARERENPNAAGKTNVDGNEIVAEIAPGRRDIVIRKQKPSMFFGSALLSYLVLLGVDSLIVTGATTSGCVRGTVVDAFSHNFRVSVVEDGCFDRGEANHALSLFDMNAKYADIIGSDEALAFLNAYPAGQFELPQLQR